jgi:enoyl-[acyl-carrier-protein] reductase (NADH)
MLSYQDYFNMLLTLVAFLGAWWMRTVWSAIKSLEQTDAQVFAKVTEIQVLIAGDYAKKHEVDARMDRLGEKMSRIDGLEAAIANNYVPKKDFGAAMESAESRLNHTMSAFIKRFDRIEEKIDKLSDRQ